MIAHAVVAVPERREMAEDVAGHSRAFVVMDMFHVGERANHQKALELLLETDADWLTMIEDDAVLCGNFLTEEGARLDHLDGSQIVSWYLGTGRWAGERDVHKRWVDELAADADRAGSEWIEADGVWHAVALSFPRALAADALHFLACETDPTDWALSNWAKYRSVPVLYSWPSLVNHPEAERHAIRFLGGRDG